MISLASWRPSLRKHPQELWWMLPICLRTRGRYAHSELVFGAVGKASLCFSATRALGVRYADRDLTDGTWDTLTLTLTPWQEAYAHQVVNTIIGEKYDLRAIFHGLFPFVTDDINTHDCSGAAGVVLSRIGKLPLPDLACWTLDPSALHRMLAQIEKPI